MASSEEVRVRFSLFFEMQLPSPTRVSERRLFHDSVEQAVLADQLGYEAVWAAEHHGLREYAHSSAPEVFLAFVAARTNRIRLGHGATLTPYRYNHPIRIAERVATLDVLSGGRVNWGSGKSGSRTEQDAFQIDPVELSDQWLEAQRMIPRMWRDEVFEWHGDHFDIPPIQVVPKPAQEPHPPMYAACTSSKTARLAGSLGLGALNFAAGTPVELAAKVSAYREQVEAGDSVGYENNNQYLCTPTSLVLDDDHLACRYGFRGAEYFWSAMQQYYASTERPIGALSVRQDDLDAEELAKHTARRADEQSPLNSVIGDPSAARDAVARFQAAGVDELILVMQTGTVPSELVTTSIRTFAEKVMPDFS